MLHCSTLDHRLHLFTPRLPTLSLSSLTAMLRIAPTLTLLGLALPSMGSAASPTEMARRQAPSPPPAWNDTEMWCGTYDFTDPDNALMIWEGMCPCNAI